MTDSFDAIYQAVRSKISSCDVGQVISNVLHDMNLSFYFERAAHAVADQFYGYGTPSAVYRPKLSKDGDQWVALYGVNLQEGVVGVGKTPKEAMTDFDLKWSKP